MGQGSISSDQGGREVLRDSLVRSARTLLHSDDPQELRSAAVALHALYASLTDVGAESEDAASTLLPAGKAISPQDGARCVLDAPRTSAYLRGVHAAIRAVQARFAERPIDVVYAGCGPFAALAFPVAAMFGSGVRFTVIDAHARSLLNARRVAERLGFDESMRDYIRADATKYVHRTPFHILIVESMLAALQAEPQVAITLNLARQIRAGGALVPERIWVDACLCEAPHAGFVPESCIPLGRVFELSRETASAFHGQFPEVIVEVPAGLEKPLHVMLRTTIRAFGEIALGEYQSGLTQPIILHETGTVCSGTRFSIRYELGSNPRFRSTRVE
jgi:hypothetical protein